MTFLALHGVTLPLFRSFFRPISSGSLLPLCSRLADLLAMIKKPPRKCTYARWAQSLCSSFFWKGLPSDVHMALLSSTCMFLFISLPVRTSYLKEWSLPHLHSCCFIVLFSILCHLALLWILIHLFIAYFASPKYRISEAKDFVLHLILHCRYEAL